MKAKVISIKGGGFRIFYIPKVISFKEDGFRIFFRPFDFCSGVYDQSGKFAEKSRKKKKKQRNRSSYEQ